MKLKAEKTVLISASLLFLVLTIPIIYYKYLAYDEAWIMSKAYSLLKNGRLAFAGMGTYMNFNLHTFTEMPLRSLLDAAVFKLFGIGIFQMRIISVVMGLIVLLLVFKITKKYFGIQVAYLSLFLLLFLRLTIYGEVSGVPLLDYSCMGRYDMDQAFWTLLSLYSFLLSLNNPKKIFLILSGLFAGLAVLSHPQTIYLPLVYFIFLLSEKKFFRSSSIFLFGAFILTLSPYLYWVLSNFRDYRDQMTLYYDRGNFSSLSFYVYNIKNEFSRYFSKHLTNESYLKFMLLPFMLIAVFFLCKEYIKNKTETHIKLFLVFLLTALGFFLLFDYTKVLIYYSSIFPVLIIVLSAIIVKVYLHSKTAALKRTIIVLLFLVFADGTWGIISKFKATFEKQNQYEVFDFLEKQIPKGANVLALSHHWFALKDCNFNDFVRVGFEFRNNKMNQVENDSANLNKILSEIKPDYIVMFDGWDGWMEFFARPYFDDFKKVWNKELKRDFKPIASYNSNIYGEIVIYEKI